MGRPSLPFSWDHALRRTSLRNRAAMPAASSGGANSPRREWSARLSVRAVSLYGPSSEGEARGG